MTDTGLSLVDENETEAYSITILEGTYELRILRGQHMFYTEIEL